MQGKPIYIASAALIFLAGCAKSPEQRYASHVEAGRKLLAAKDYSRAILEFKNAITAKPADAEAHYQLGMTYLAVGDWKQASTYLRHATELNSTHVGAQVRFSEILAGSDNPSALEEARKRLRDVLAATPGNIDALTALGIAEWKLSDPAEAERHLRAAFLKRSGDLSPAVALARIKILTGKFDEAENILKQAAAQKPPSALAMTVLGEFYLLRQRKTEAQAELERALRVDPKQPLAMLYLAGLLASTGKMQEADALFRRITTLPSMQYKTVHATFLFETGRKEEAIAELERLTNGNPDEASFRDQYLAALIATDQVARAEKELGRFIGKNSSDPHMLLQRAALYIGLGRLEEAEKDLQRVLYLRSNSAQGQFLYSKVHEARGYYLSQRQALNDALRFDPALLPARLSLARLLSSRNAAKTALHVLEETPEEQKNLLAVAIERNWAHLALGNFAEVERALAAELKHPSPEVAVLLATLRLSQSRTAEAREVARRVLDANSEDIRALEIISRSYAMEKNLDAAVRELAVYAAKRPKVPGLQYFMGTVLSSYGRPVEARAAFQQALQVNPRHMESQLALVQLDIADSNLEAASRTLEKLNAQGGNLTVSLWLGNLYLIKGEHKEAIRHYRMVLELDPNQVSALNNLAWLLAEEGIQIDQALGLAQKAAELAPDNAAVQNTLGRIFYQKGLYTMAVRYLERAITSGTNAKREFYLGAAYLKSGNRAKGEVRLQAVVQKYPGTWEAKQARQLIDR
jgi:tetratricopeptide (TPR) repeat protein